MVWCAINVHVSANENRNARVSKLKKKKTYFEKIQIAHCVLGMEEESDVQIQQGTMKLA